MKTALNKNTIRMKVSTLCVEHPEIIAAYLFGSYAKDQAKEKSDVDIAVLLKDNKQRSFQYLGFKVSLEKALDWEVDLTILNQAGEILKHQVRKYGYILYDVDPPGRKEWEIMSRKFYQDFIHLHKIYMQRMHDRLGVKNG